MSEETKREIYDKWATGDWSSHDLASEYGITIGELFKILHTQKLEIEDDSQ